MVRIEFDDRPSESPYIARVWRSWSDDITRVTSIASAHWTLITWWERGRPRVAAHGPERGAVSAPVPPHTHWVAIRLALGTVLARVPPDRIVDTDVEFPDVSRGSVRLFGHTLPLSDWYHSAEEHVHGMVRAGVIVRDPIVTDILRGRSPEVTARTVRRRFLRATGLTPGAVRQIERARDAAVRIQGGAPFARVAYDLGYYDQPHLARSLGRFIGHTGTELRDGTAGQLSLLYKT